LATIRAVNLIPAIGGAMAFASGGIEGYASAMHRLGVLSVALLLAGAVLGAPQARAQQFVPGTEDVPLMRELAPVKDSDIVFDKPEGRIIEASARGKVSKAAVRTFYASTLPQLGWKASGESWTRETETLHLDFAGHDGDLWVTFTLLPK
jgi:hypothetical protein